MSRRFLPLLAPGLLLVCCDQPAPKQSSRERTNAEPVPPRIREEAPPDAVPEVPPDSPAGLKTSLEQALGIKASGDREKAVANVAWNALEIDPELAIEAFKHLPSGSAEKMRLIRHYAMRAAEEDMEEALAWAAGLESEQERSAAYSQIALAMAETDPEGAAKLLAESGKPGRELDVAVVQVVQRWAAQKPAEAADWLAMFPAGKAREAGIKITAGQWLKADAKAAFDWLAALKDTGVRQEAALGFEEAILQQTKEVQESWLQHADEKLRSELEQQRERAIEEVGDNIPKPSATETAPSLPEAPPGE